MERVSQRDQTSSWLVEEDINELLLRSDFFAVNKDGISTRVDFKPKVKDDDVVNLDSSLRDYPVGFAPRSYSGLGQELVKSNFHSLFGTINIKASIKVAAYLV